MNLEYLNGSLFFHMFLYSYANSAGILSYLCYVSIGMVLRYMFGIIARREKDSTLLKLNGLMCLNELNTNGFIYFSTAIY